MEKGELRKLFVTNLGTSSKSFSVDLSPTLNLGYLDVFWISHSHLKQKMSFYVLIFCALDIRKLRNPEKRTHSTKM